ncbi:hypothetical protein B0I37DRAFT_317145 [Chaetomium sp. MPI-CAGE-AT-0009]|nr:hypothetical protein B0I37DRAFT_317145 [Chaetomium sp. MPI-CAGE-AT-0009]
MALPNLTAGFEIKFLLKSEEILNAGNEFNDELLSVFTTPPTVTKINVMFMDTDNKALYQARWSARIRKKEGTPNLELTYKKRYTIEGEDIDAALTAVNRDGFNASRDNEYEAQVEWGYKKMTLSISHERKVSDSGSGGTSLPDVESARSMIAGKAPDELRNWGKDALQEARVYGPILTTRLTGRWKGIKLTVEVWPIVIAAERRLEYIVEASVKADTKDEAGDVWRSLKDMLSGRGWLCPGDSLKTQLVMDNY